MIDFQINSFIALRFTKLEYWIHNLKYNQKESVKTDAEFILCKCLGLQNCIPNVHTFILLASSHGVHSLKNVPSF